MVQGVFPGDLSILDQLLEVLIEGDAAVLAVRLDHRRELCPLAAANQMRCGTDDPHHLHRWSTALPIRFRHQFLRDDTLQGEGEL